ncbi:hypothetical protein ABKJ86_004266 [Escherichia coli]|uniref:acyltransferase n=3 Tax=Enterobacteriaceae TaxID=543 RepID=UPI00092DE145|nr:hypothetical protein [Escherichia coli]APJ89371.1 hypothetical protein RG31_23285 [Escherichia coli]
MKKVLMFILSLPATVVFNFRYLPFHQAIKLPIILYKPTINKLRGTIEINSKNIKFGMIKLGVHSVSIFPNTGFIFENLGGKIVFNGNVVIGSNSSISVGEKGRLEFGHDIVATSGLKLVCYHYVRVSDLVRFGWDCMIMDTGFHPLKDRDTAKFIDKAYGPIILGKNNWFANGVLIMKNTRTVDYSIFGARSVLTKFYDVPEFSLLVGSPPKVVRNNIYRDMYDCTEVYVEYQG